LQRLSGSSSVGAVKGTRRVTTVLLAAAALGVAPSAASAQLLQLGKDDTYKAGPLTCVNPPPPSNLGDDTNWTRGCTLSVGPERSVFCGDVQDSPYDSFHHFLGCRLDAGAYQAECGVTEDVVTDRYIYDTRTRFGCTASVGAQHAGAYCEDKYRRDSNAHFDEGRRYTCAVGVVTLSCEGPGDVPDGCRLTVGTRLACDIDRAHPAASLRSCVMDAAARRS
jgi:hypothetical protein